MSWSEDEYGITAEFKIAKTTAANAAFLQSLIGSASGGMGGGGGGRGVAPPPSGGSFGWM